MSFIDYLKENEDVQDPKKYLSKMRFSILKKLKKILKFSDKAPFYRSVTKRMNLFGICENKNYMAFKKEVIYKFGFGTFDLINDMKNNPPECPACEFRLREVSTCAFW